MSWTRQEIETRLPSFMQSAARANAPLRGMLEAMAALPAPDLERFARLDVLFDPRSTEERFVAFLASWVDLARVFEIPVTFQARGAAREPGVGRIGGSLRELVAIAADLSQWRGTQRGLVLFLEVATGVRGFAVEKRVADAAGRPRPFHVRLVVPHSARAQESLVRRIIEMEKPAHVTVELCYAAEVAA